MKKTLICFLGLASLSGAQGVPGGTINGIAIPESVFRPDNRYPCGDLANAIRNAAREDLARAIGLTVTPEDIAATKASHKPPDFAAQSKFVIDQEKMMIAALTAVDNGQNPDQVYKEMLQPKGVDPAVWKSYQQQWKDPKGHALILSRSNWTPEVLAKGYARIDYTPEARRRKLDALVDQELAAKDPVFRLGLEHLNAGHGLPLDEKQYVESHRRDYWKAQEAKLSVVLNDPTLAQKCGLATK